MNTIRMALAGAGALALTGLGGSLLNARERDGGARPGRQAGIPNVALQTHEGRTVRFYDDLVRDKLVVINMMYAGCNNTCPPMTQNLVRVQQMLAPRIGQDIFMYSLTLRPEQDSPEDLAHYARQHHTRPGWLFLTGKPADMERLRFALGFFDPDPKVDRQEGRHVGMVRIGNDVFRRWGMAPALADPRQIVAAIQHLDRKMPPRSVG